MNTKYLYLIGESPFFIKMIKPTEYKLLPDNYIQIGDNEPTPIEDYGNYIFSDIELSEDEAFKKFLDLLP